MTPGERLAAMILSSVDIILHSSLWPISDNGARVRSAVYVSITTSSMAVIIWVNYGQTPLD